jgi:uncharacterized hydrophobic protein (TIGR00271 family)
MSEAGETVQPSNGAEPPKKGGNKFFRQIRVFLSRTLDIREGIDKELAIEGIKNGIEFRGYAVWILVASIFIASVGLNVNSAAVVIGAMLISPLMGPILGLGLSIGTNDFETLIKSLKNLGIAVLASLITSTIYFTFTPFKEAQSELLARTQPTSMDVLIAFFGGVAGIVAAARKEKTNVIPGVAIATALMPPLCTAGYGLATWQLGYFLGAFYLFLINSVFIALATFLVVRYLRFPMAHWVDAKKAKRYRIYIIVAVVLTILPSGYLTYRIFLESSYRVRQNTFMTNAQQFIDESYHVEGADIVSSKFVFNDTANRIELFILGKEVSAEELAILNADLANYNLKKTHIKILQEKDVKGDLSSPELVSQLENSYRRNEEIAQTKDQEIKQLKKQLDQLNKYAIDVPQFRDELVVLYPEINRFAFANAYEADKLGTLDTIPTFWVNWDDKAKEKHIEDREAQLHQWLKVKFRMDTVRVMRY